MSDRMTEALEVFAIGVLVICGTCMTIIMVAVAVKAMTIVFQ
jgi:hypothetical protein